jgi:hypothetical protein
MARKKTRVQTSIEATLKALDQSLAEFGIRESHERLGLFMRTLAAFFVSDENLRQDPDDYFILEQYPNLAALTRELANMIVGYGLSEAQLARRMRNRQKVPAHQQMVRRSIDMARAGIDAKKIAKEFSIPVDRLRTWWSKAGFRLRDITD